MASIGLSGGLQIAPLLYKMPKVAKLLQIILKFFLKRIDEKCAAEACEDHDGGQRHHAVFHVEEDEHDAYDPAYEDRSIPRFAEAADGLKEPKREEDDRKPAIVS